MAQNISVPDIGDFSDVEIIEVLVKPGDQVNKNDPIVTIESDKSSVEIPSPSSGEIKDLKVKIGDKVSEGSILATIENKVSDKAINKEVETKEEKHPQVNGNLNTKKPVREVKKIFAASPNTSVKKRFNLITNLYKSLSILIPKKIE